MLSLHRRSPLSCCGARTPGRPCRRAPPKPPTATSFRCAAGACGGPVPLCRRCAGAGRDLHAGRQVRTGYGARPGRRPRPADAGPRPRAATGIRCPPAEAENRASWDPRNDPGLPSCCATATRSCSSHLCQGLAAPVESPRARIGLGARLSRWSLIQPTAPIHSALPTQKARCPRRTEP